MILPCDLPCPACGYNKADRKILCVRVKSSEYKIEHKCLCCGKIWYSLPLTDEQYNQLIADPPILVPKFDGYTKIYESDGSIRFIVTDPITGKLVFSKEGPK